MALDKDLFLYDGDCGLCARSVAWLSARTDGSVTFTPWQRAGDGDDATHVQLRLVQHTFPRYSDRANTGLGEITHATSPWLDAEGDLA